MASAMPMIFYQPAIEMLNYGQIEVVGRLDSICSLIDFLQQKEDLPNSTRFAVLSQQCQSFGFEFEEDVLMLAAYYDNRMTGKPLLPWNADAFQCGLKRCVVEQVAGMEVKFVLRFISIAYWCAYVTLPSDHPLAVRLPEEDQLGYTYIERMEDGSVTIGWDFGHTPFTTMLLPDESFRDSYVCLAQAKTEMVDIVSRLRALQQPKSYAEAARRALQ